MALIRIPFCLMVFLVDLHTPQSPFLPQLFLYTGGNFHTDLEQGLNDRTAKQQTHVHILTHDTLYIHTFPSKS